MEKPRTLVLYTGGTIGMVETRDGLSPSSSCEKLFRTSFPESAGSFDWREYPVLLDSSSMSQRHWNLIGADIAAAYDDYDSFIVLHGTDTMAYTASALSFMFENLSKPVILTGSQRPLAEKGSDAPANLALAFTAALSRINEVLVAFGGRLMRGNRTVKVHTSADTGFDSPNLKPFDLKTASEPPRGGFRFTPVSDAPVGMLRLYPGIGGAELAAHAAAGTKGLVLETFGAGNLPHTSPGFMEALVAYAGSGALIGAVSECRAGGIAAGRYAAGRALMELGIVPLGDMTAPCALAKLAWLLGQDFALERRKELFGTPLRGEMQV